MLTMIQPFNRVLAAAVSSALIIAAPAARGASVTISDSSCTTFSTQQSGTNVTLTCTGGTTTPPSTCSVRASPTSLGSSGGSVTLTATNCGAISGWTGAKSASPGTSAQWTDTIPANAGTSSVQYTYTVSGGSGSGSATVFQSGQSPTNTGGGGAISCSGYATTRVLDLKWGSIGTGNVSVFSSSAGGFGNNDILVVRFTTPNQNQSSNTSKGSLKGLQYVDQPLMGRTAKLSDTPCDVSGAVGISDSFGADFTVGVASARYPAPPMLTPGKTYYLNVVNQAYGTQTCAPGQSCNVIVQLYKPSGL